MDRDKSDIGIQARVTESIITRDRIMLLWIKRGVIALILAIAFYLSYLAMLDGLAIWKIAIVVLASVVSVVIVRERKRIDKRRIRELEEENRKLRLELKGWVMTKE